MKKFEDDELKEIFRELEEQGLEPMLFDTLTKSAEGIDSTKAASTLPINVGRTLPSGTEWLSTQIFTTSFFMAVHSFGKSFHTFFATSAIACCALTVPTARNINMNE